MSEDKNDYPTQNQEIKDYLDKLFVVSQGHQIGGTDPDMVEKKAKIVKNFKKSTQEIILNSVGQTDEFVKDLQKHGNQSEVATKLMDIGMQSMILKGKGKPPEFIEELQTVALNELLRRYPDQKEYVKKEVLISKSLKKYASTFGWEEE
ncbi:MAG TPA: hypothetical protein VF185_00790 [Patescibacteria group bacterium]